MRTEHNHIIAELASSRDGAMHELVKDMELGKAILTIESLMVKAVAANRYTEIAKPPEQRSPNDSFVGLWTYWQMGMEKFEQDPLKRAQSAVDLLNRIHPKGYNHTVSKEVFTLFAAYILDRVVQAMPVAAPVWRAFIHLDRWDNLHDQRSSEYTKILKATTEDKFSKHWHCRTIEVCQLLMAMAEESSYLKERDSFPAFVIELLWKTFTGSWGARRQARLMRTMLPLLAFQAQGKDGQMILDKLEEAVASQIVALAKFAEAAKAFPKGPEIDSRIQAIVCSFNFRTMEVRGVRVDLKTSHVAFHVDATDVQDVARQVMENAVEALAEWRQKFDIPPNFQVSVVGNIEESVAQAPPSRTIEISLQTQI